MLAIELGPYRISYGCIATHTPGVNITPGGQKLYLNGGLLPPIAVHPVAPVKFRASFDITIGPGAARFYGEPLGSKPLEKMMFEECDPLLPPIELGFVQNLVSGRRQVTYAPTDRTPDKPKRFIENHDAYPLLDRAIDSVDPWYRTRQGSFHKEFTTGHFNFLPPFKTERVQLEVDDAPELFFPDPAPGSTATIDWNDVFVTCTAARVGKELHCLHYYKWKVSAQGELRRLARNAGIEIIDEEYVLAPYAFPVDFQLAGPLAQASKMSLVTTK